MRIPDFSAIWQVSKQVTMQIILIACATFALYVFDDVAFPHGAAAYPFWAQETAPITPREATRRIQLSFGTKGC